MEIVIDIGFIFKTTPMTGAGELATQINLNSLME